MADVRVSELRAQRRQGEIITPSFTLPANMRGEIQFVADIPTADYENTSNTISASLYQEDATVPGGWRFRTGNTWRGGTRISDGITNPPPVFFSLSVGDSEKGKAFRVEVDIPTQMDVGFSVNRAER